MEVTKNEEESKENNDKPFENPKKLCQSIEPLPQNMPMTSQKRMPFSPFRLGSLKKGPEIVFNAFTLRKLALTRPRHGSKT